MTPPPPLECTRCSYTTRENITSYAERTQEMLLHIQMEHYEERTSKDERKTENRERSGDVGDPRLAAKIDKPKLSMPCSKTKWDLFEHSWGWFKKACGLKGEAVVYQLANCLDEDISLKLFNVSRGKYETEEELLRILKYVLWESSNTMVERNTFHKMKQKTDENKNSV